VERQKTAMGSVSTLTQAGLPEANARSMAGRTMPRQNLRVWRQVLANWVELEDPSALGRCHRIVEIDTVDDADELDTEGNASCERAKDITEVPHALLWIQFSRAYFFCSAPYHDGRAASSTQVPHPLGLTPWRPDPAPAIYRNDRQWCRARQAALPAANGDEPIGAERHASFHQELQDGAEEQNPPWNT